MSATGKPGARNLVLLAEDLAKTRQWEREPTLRTLA